MVIFLSHSEFYQLKLGIGEGSNNKVELLAFCGLLFLSNLKNIGRLQVQFKVQATSFIFGIMVGENL